VNITVRLQQVLPRDPEKDLNAAYAELPLLVCDRCHDVEAIVVSIMHIAPIEQTWALCSACEGQLPLGFKVI
jgi:hypothetical protein